MSYNRCFLRGDRPNQLFMCASELVRVLLHEISHHGIGCNLMLLLQVPVPELILQLELFCPAYNERAFVPLFNEEFSVLLNLPKFMHAQIVRDKHYVASEASKWTQQMCNVGLTEIIKVDCALIGNILHRYCISPGVSLHTLIKLAHRTCILPVLTTWTLRYDTVNLEMDNEELKAKCAASELKNEALKVENVSILEQRDELARTCLELTCTVDMLIAEKDDLLFTIEKLMRQQYTSAENVKLVPGDVALRKKTGLDLLFAVFTLRKLRWHVVRSKARNEALAVLLLSRCKIAAFRKLKHFCLVHRTLAQFTACTRRAGLRTFFHQMVAIKTSCCKAIRTICTLATRQWLASGFSSFVHFRDLRRAEAKRQAKQAAKVKAEAAARRKTEADALAASKAQAEADIIAEAVREAKEEAEAKKVLHDKTVENAIARAQKEAAALADPSMRRTMKDLREEKKHVAAAERTQKFLDKKFESLKKWTKDINFDLSLFDDPTDNTLKVPMVQLINMDVDFSSDEVDLVLDYLTDKPGGVVVFTDEDTTNFGTSKFITLMQSLRGDSFALYRKAFNKAQCCYLVFLQIQHNTEGDPPLMVDAMRSFSSEGVLAFFLAQRLRFALELPPKEFNYKAAISISTAYIPMIYDNRTKLGELYEYIVYSDHPECLSWLWLPTETSFISLFEYGPITKSLCLFLRRQTFLPSTILHKLRHIKIEDSEVCEHALSLFIDRPNVFIIKKIIEASVGSNFSPSFSAKLLKNILLQLKYAEKEKNKEIAHMVNSYHDRLFAKFGPNSSVNHDLLLAKIYSF
jgi:hypothetical protein